MLQHCASYLGDSAIGLFGNAALMMCTDTGELHYLLSICDRLSEFIQQSSTLVVDVTGRAYPTDGRKNVL
jgi:hypothetical protein